MKGSIKTLVAILVLVGGALETNSMDAAETSQRVVANQETKMLCFGYLRDNFRTYFLPNDVKEMMERYYEKNRQESNFDENIVKIALHETPPISCPELVDFGRKVLNADDNCRWLTENKNFARQAMEIFSFDRRTSEVYLAYEVCARLASLEIKKKVYQSVHDELVESYKRIEVPGGVEALIKRLEKAEKDVNSKESWEMAIICKGILVKERDVLQHMMNSGSDSEERVLFDQIVLANFDWEMDGIKDIHKATAFCLDFLQRRQSGQSVTERTSKPAGSNNDQMQE